MIPVREPAARLKVRSKPGADLLGLRLLLRVVAMLEPGLEQRAGAATSGAITASNAPRSSRPPVSSWFMSMCPSSWHTIAILRVALASSG